MGSCGKVRDVRKIAQEPVSLETLIGEEEDSHLGDFIEDDTAIAPTMPLHHAARTADTVLVR